jgi:hypothetical protein
MTAHVRIEKRGRAVFALRVRDADVGDVRDRVARFHGFTAPGEARTAGAALCDVLEDWYHGRARAGHLSAVAALLAEPHGRGDALSIAGPGEGLA